MKAKINEKIICIPPYISTSWEHVTFMQAEENETGSLNLIIHLDSPTTITIRNLDKALIDLAFSAHLKYMEATSEQEEQLAKGPMGIFQQLFGATPEQIETFRFSLSNESPGLEKLEMAMQHDPSLTEAPLLPQEVVTRIAQMARMIAGENLSGFPKAEPHCQCPHCQIARAVHDTGETVSESDLTLPQWEVSQIGEHLYQVTNARDHKEHYQVFLGSPVGCTCGQPHCAHLKVVLHS